MKFIKVKSPSEREIKDLEYLNLIEIVPKKKKKGIKWIKVSSYLLFVIVISSLVLLTVLIINNERKLFNSEDVNANITKLFSSWRNFTLPNNTNTGKYNYTKNETLIFNITELSRQKGIYFSFNYDNEVKAQLNKQLNLSLINPFPRDKKKFALCTVGRIENLYARSFVIYYLKLGVDKIYIYDANEKEGERFSDVLQDFIDKGYVEIINMRGRMKRLQFGRVNQLCYENYSQYYDWILYFTFDEYLYLSKGFTLNNFVQQSKFKDCSSISYYFRHYSDSNHYNYNNYSVYYRFNFTIPYYIDSKQLFNTASMSRGKIKTNETDDQNSTQVPKEKQKNIDCTAEGRIMTNRKDNYTLNGGFIKKFEFKSTEEYCIKLMAMKFFDRKWNYWRDNIISKAKLYLFLNNRTNEKKNLLLKCIS